MLDCHSTTTTTTTNYTGKQQQTTIQANNNNNDNINNNNKQHKKKQLHRQTITTSKANHSTNISVLTKGFPFCHRPNLLVAEGRTHLSSGKAMTYTGKWLPGLRTQYELHFPDSPDTPARDEEMSIVMEDDNFISKTIGMAFKLSSCALFSCRICGLWLLLTLRKKTCTLQYTNKTGTVS